MRGAEDALELRREGCLFQRGEYPAAIVADHQQAQIGARLVRTDHQARRVVQDRQVAEERNGRATAGGLPGEGRADRRRHQAVDAARPPAREDPQASPRGQMLVQVTDRHAGGGPQQGAVRQDRGKIAGKPGLADARLGIQDRVSGLPRRGVGLLPGR